MLNQFSRTELIFGRENMQKVYASRVAVFGIGGVGGYVVEALVRSGVGTLDIIDDDKVCLTNLNRQLYATQDTIGQYKVDVAEARCKAINPDVIIHKYKTFYMPETSNQFDFSQYDYVVDCIDTVSGKVQLVLQAQKSNTPIICCMGAGNKTDPSKLEVTDIFKTSVDPLARVMRREMKNRGIKHLKVVYSKEEPVEVDEEIEALCKEESADAADSQRSGAPKKSIPGSNAFVPPAAGLLLAAEVIKDLIKRE